MADIGGAQTIACTAGIWAVNIPDGVRDVILEFATVDADTTLAISSGTQRSGQTVVCILPNDGTIRTVTFSTGFMSKGVLTGQASKTAIVTFISNSTTYFEQSRTEGL